MANSVSLWTVYSWSVGKEIIWFYRTQTLFTVFRKSRHFALTWIHFTLLHHHIYPRYVLILFSHLCRRISSCFFRFVYGFSGFLPPITSCLVVGWTYKNVLSRSPSIYVENFVTFLRFCIFIRFYDYFVLIHILYSLSKVHIPFSAWVVRLPLELEMSIHYNSVDRISSR
jgi:hypothetical protein